MYWLTLAALSLFFALFLLYSLRKGAPWMPTPRARIRALLRSADLKPGEVVMDLGCGDARVLLLAAREFGARGIGVEVHPLLALIARLRVRLAGLDDKIVICCEDAFKTSLAEADVLYLFLLQGTNVALQEKLKRELRPGTRIVSYAFTLPRFATVPSDDLRHHVYLVESVS